MVLHSLISTTQVCSSFDRISLGSAALPSALSHDGLNAAAADCRELCICRCFWMLRRWFEVLQCSADALEKQAFSAKAPKWRVAGNGLNVEGQCRNAKCNAYGCLIIDRKVGNAQA